MSANDDETMMPQSPSDALVTEPAIDGSVEPRDHSTLSTAELRARKEWSVRNAPAGRFGKYDILGELGRGGMGIIYKAREPSLRRTVALKMMLADHMASDEQLLRFAAEAQAAASLRHPNIVQIFDAGYVDGVPFFAMQFVDGCNLSQALRRGPMTVERTVRILADVAKAVAYLHDHDIIHRDLKPANILLDEADCPFVTDFGVVKVEAAGPAMTTTGVILGTPSYMAPEQAAGRNHEVGTASDVYSLGAILYELLVGNPPFRAPTQLDTLVAVLESEPVRPRQVDPTIPIDIERVCLKCLSKDPKQRYESAAALAEDLERFGRGEAVLAKPQSKIDSLVRWVRQEPALVSRLAIVALVIAIAQVSYQALHSVSLARHCLILGTLLVAAGASACCQWLLRRGVHPNAVRRLWITCDVLLFTAVLILVEILNSPLLIVYPILVVSSGLWFRERLVWFTTATALAGYGLLLGNAAWREGLGPSPHHHVIFVICLIGFGFMVASQVRRVRALSRYYENRNAP